LKYFATPVPSAEDRIANVTSSSTIPQAPDLNQINKKFQYKERSNQKTPLTTNGFEPYVKTVENGEIKYRPSHACGPIIKSTQTIKTSILNPEMTYDAETIQNWTPHLALSVFDKDVNRALTAAEITSKQESQRYVPHYFLNPMQDLDYLVLEALSRFTFGGALMDGLTKFLVGTGFKPELELINPSNDEDKDAKEIAAGSDIISTLVQIDDQLNQNDENFIDASFIDKISALITAKNIYNRAALMFSYDKPVSVNGIKYKEIPSSLKFAHPRDLGIIDADPGTWALKSVQWRNAFYMVPAKDMIYLWNPLISAKTRNSWLYGDSMMMPMIDALRVVRKNIGVNFQAMAEATWSGIPLIFVKPQGQTPSDKQAEYQAIANGLVRGGPNIILENPMETRVDNIDFNPKVNEFVGLTEFLLKYCVAATGLPHSMFYDEAASNRATLLGKIQLATSTVINPIRNMDGRSISLQWYQRWFRLIYKDKKPEMLKKYRIKMAFSDLNIAEWFDKVDAANEVDSRKTLTDEAYGALAGISNYQNKVLKGATVNPGGGNRMKNTFNLNNMK